MAEEIGPSSYLLYQASLNTEIMPEELRTAYVVPVFKNGERYREENYRPISLTSIYCKVIEHIIVSSIRDFAEKQNIMCPEQHFLYKCHSCKSQLLGFVGEAIERDCLVDVHTLRLIIDFSKAFDMVYHNFLINKLCHHRNQRMINLLIKHFLAYRRQSVLLLVGGCRSEFAPVESGVPKGLVLGLALFLLYINGLPEGLTSRG